MGTNYYAKNCAVHIGKRSAAGLYCWDCGQTLCKGGTRHIHGGHSQWYAACPSCGKAPSGDHNAAYMELGFQKAADTKPTGVSTCSSFSWAIKPGELSKYRAVWDEYGRRMTRRQFEKMLAANCPIIYTSSIGKDFC